jgi:hypothetical protein
MRACNAISQGQIDCEIVAIALFNRAYTAGITADRRWVDEQIAQLQTHPPGCRCPMPCQLRVSPKEVAYLAISWQRQYAASRVLAHR